MAPKSKGLHFESQEPAFLKRLRAEYGGERREFQAARPKNARLATTAEDDDPTMVDEEGRSVTKEEYQAMVEDPTLATNESVNLSTMKKDASGQDAAGLQNQRKPNDVHDEPKDHMQQGIAQPGQTQRKRKQGKVIGADGEDDASKEASEDNAKGDKAKKPKPRKAKKVKLSFQGEDAE
ncbi:MAG: hypothetical protein Q9160_002349 [Pyrenula sp. 1 TL-2023]